MEVLLPDGQMPQKLVSGKKNIQEIEEIQKFIYKELKNRGKTYEKLETASDSGLSAGSREIMKFPGNIASI